MALVLRGSVLLPVPIERAWHLWMDAARFTQWQSALLAVRELTGPVSTVGTTYVLDHGPKLQRQVRVLIAERPVRHVIEQRGLGVHDETVATFEPEGEGTRLTVVTYGHMGRLLRLLALLFRSERELAGRIGIVCGFTTPSQTPEIADFDVVGRARPMSPSRSPLRTRMDQRSG